MKCDIIKIVLPGPSRGHLSAKNLRVILVTNIEIGHQDIFIMEEIRQKIEMRGILVLNIVRMEKCIQAK